MSIVFYYESLENVQVRKNAWCLFQLEEFSRRKRVVSLTPAYRRIRRYITAKRFSKKLLKHDPSHANKN